jgi:hypothetical protein
MVTIQVMMACLDVRLPFVGTIDMQRGITYNGQGETFFVEVRIVHQPSSQSEDDERDENLEDADDKDPSGRDQDVVGLPFRLLHDGRVCCV